MKNNCSWCTLPTDMPVVFAAKSPLLEWLEKKIDRHAIINDVHRNDIWGNNADWSKVNLGSQFEEELVFYDETSQNRYRVSLIVGNSYNNNMISIERL